jgi:hypothetical protein
MKMCTLMLAGTPPLKFPGNRPTKDESSIFKWNKDMIYMIDQRSESLSLNID